MSKLLIERHYRNVHSLLELVLVQRLGAALPEACAEKSREPSSATQKYSGYMSALGLKAECWRRFSLGSSLSRLRDIWNYSEKVGLVALTRQAFDVLDVEVNDFVDRTRELYQILGLVWDDEEEDLYYSKYAWLALQDQLIPAIKHSTNLIFTTFYELEDPPADSNLPGMELWSSRMIRNFRSWKQQKVRRSKLNQWRIYTIFQGFKKSLLPLRPDAILGSLKKHRAALTADPKFLGDKDRLEAIVVRLAQRLNLYPRCSFSGAITGLSNKSTIEMGLAGKGQVGYAIGILDDKLGTSFTLVRLQEEFLGYVPYSRSVRRRRRSDPRTGSLGGGDREFEELRGPVLELETICEKLWELNNDEKSAYQAEPSIVLEPLKARIITKPGAGDYMVLSRIQTKVWSELQKKFGCFSLIGRPLEIADIEDHFSWRHSQPQGLEWGFCSGDYSAATDNLKAEVTEMIAERIFEGIRMTDPHLYSRIMKTLYGTTILWNETHLPRTVDCPWMNLFYSTYKSTASRGNLSSLMSEKDFQKWMLEKAGLDSGVQTNGQLMGHVLSFPLLCLANLACYLYAYEEFYEMKKGTFPWAAAEHVLINGDDILFAGSRAFYDHWLRTCPKFGFIPSIGKNLFSSEICQVNSALFYVRPTPVATTTSYYEILNGLSSYQTFSVPYANMGILVGRRKGDARGGHWMAQRCSPVIDGKWSERSAEVGFVSNLSRVVKVLPQLRREVLDMCPPQYRSSVHEAFRASCTQHYQKIFPGLPWHDLYLEDYDEVNEHGLSRFKYLVKSFGGLKVPDLYDKRGRVDVYSSFLPDLQDDQHKLLAACRRESKRNCSSFGKAEPTYVPERVPVFRDLPVKIGALRETVKPHCKETDVDWSWFERNIQYITEPWL